MKNILLFLLCIPFAALAQNKDTVLKYQDQNLELTSLKNAVFYGAAIKTGNGWYLHAVYADTTILLKAYYKDKALKVKEGPYVQYYPKGIKAIEGYYVNNKMEGAWKFWYPNGNLKDSGSILHGRLSGVWKSWYPNGKLKQSCTFKSELSSAEMELLQKDGSDGSGQPYSGIREGSYTSWYENGNIESSGSLHANFAEGEWKWYHSNGKQSTTEFYKKGIVTGLTCFDSTEKESGATCSISRPALLKNYGDYKNYIYENLTWPKEALKQRLEGDVEVKFTITKEGTLENLTIKTEHALLRKTIADLFTAMGDWYPAVSHNRFIDSEEKIVIPFYKN